MDKKLISLHQWIVDETERKPGWWGEQVLLPSTIVAIITRVIRWNSGFDAVFLLLTLFVGAFGIMAARNEALFKQFGEAVWVRGVFLGLIAINVFALFVQFSGLNVLDIISCTLFASFYYFAACENPRPKKRKEKLVLSTT